jgi:hypothetical protein
MTGQNNNKTPYLLAVLALVDALRALMDAI